MLGFINTSILFGLVGVFIPLLIHLLARQKVKQVYFSSLVFIKQIQKQHFKRIHIRQILLLILRCLAVFFIIMAFARPTFKTGFLFQGTSKASVVIALDHSMSMSRGDIWIRAQQGTKQIAGLLNASDQVALIGDRQIPVSLPLFQHTHLIKKIQQTVPLYSVPSADSLLKMADDILSSAEINREIYWITDLQKTAFHDTADKPLYFHHVDQCYVISIQEEIPNVALVEGGIANQIISPGGTLRVSAKVKNYSDQSVDAVLVRLTLNQSLVAQKVVALPAGGQRWVTFSVSPRESGWISGKITLEDDDFLPDNQRCFSTFIPSRIHVLILSNQRRDILPVKLALMPQHWRRGFEISEKIVGTDWIKDLDRADVVYAVNYSTFTEMEMHALRRFLDNGGGFILIPGPETNLRQLNERLLKRSGIVMGNLVRSEENDGYRSFGQIDFRHPLFDRVFEKGREQLRSPQFYQSIQVADPGKSQILIRYKDGEPFLMVLPCDHGNMIILTSGIVPPWSDFQTAPFFAPLIHRMTLYSAMTLNRKKDDVCGQPIHFMLQTVPDDQSRYSIQLPSGEKRDVLPEKAGRKIRLSYRLTETPGVYRFFQDDSLLCLKAVNMNPDESDFSPINAEMLKKRLQHLPLTVLNEPASVAKAVRKARWGREIGWEMLLLAMILLFFEMMLSRAGTSDQK